MEKVERDVLKANEDIAKLLVRRQRLKQTIETATRRDKELVKKIEGIQKYLMSVKSTRASLPDFVTETNLPAFTDLPSEWFELQYDTMWELKRFFKGCIKRDGCKNRQWCVIDVVKIFIEIFVEQNAGAIKLEQKHQRAYFYSTEKNDFVRYDTPVAFRHATTRLGNFFNDLVRDYLWKVNREKRGHAAILHEKGLDVVAPYCCFNFWDYEDHKRDFVKPVKLYDDSKLMYLLNRSADAFRKKFPRYYKINKCSETLSTGSAPSGSSDISEDETGLRKMLPLSTPTVITV